jgi:hypothetical protein
VGAVVVLGVLALLLSLVLHCSWAAREAYATSAVVLPAKQARPPRTPPRPAVAHLALQGFARATPARPRATAGLCAPRRTRPVARALQLLLSVPKCAAFQKFESSFSHLLTRTLQKAPAKPNAARPGRRRSSILAVPLINVCREPPPRRRRRGSGCGRIRPRPTRVGGVAACPRAGPVRVEGPRA